MKNRPDARPVDNRRPWNSLLRVSAPIGCLFLLAVPLVLRSLSLGILHRPGESLPEPHLQWQRDLGETSARRAPPVESEVSPAQSDLIFPLLLSVEDAVEWRRSWVLLDRRSGKIHFLNPDSGTLKSVGGEGPGPGELQDPVALALEDSVIWVLNQRGFVLDRFSMKGEFLARRRIQGGRCLVGLAKELTILPGFGVFLLRVCPASFPGPGTAWVERIEPDGKLTPALSLSLGEPGSRRLHLLREPALGAGSGNLFLGTQDTPCIGVFDSQGAPEEPRCLPDYLRPRVPAERQSDLERRLGRIAELGFLPVEIPDHLPWYDGLFPTSRGLVVRRVRGETDRDLVLLPPEGVSRVTKISFPENTFVGEETILTVQDLLQGTRVTVYPNPWVRIGPRVPTGDRTP